MNAKPSDLVTFEVEWYLMTNMAMLIFSATLIVHISNAYRSLQLNRQFPSNKYFIFNMLESFAGVSCHLCRISDYFFMTDCHFKGYFNVVFYYISTGLATMIMGHRCFADTPLRHVYGMITILLHVVKLCTTLKFAVTLVNITGKFSECLPILDVKAFITMLMTEITLNAFLFAWWMVIVGIRIYQQPDRYSKVFREGGAGYTMVSAAVNLILLSCMVNNVSFGLNPEVLLQTKWAIESKMCIAQLEALAKDMRRGNKNGNSKVHSLTPGWTWASSKKSNDAVSSNRRLQETSIA
ncbi:hypothetical protein K7432_009598 [Basidiobolus ranarum]|uniref:Uncharacterized protein n=1 Tax=Basidiobolus ranarum TaxID=34480 RepID=A0ABR2WQ01_9FUNG